MTRGLSGPSPANVQKFLAGVQYRPGTPAAAHGSPGAGSDGQTKDRGDGKRCAGPFAYSWDIARNGGLGRGQGIRSLDTQSTHFRVGRGREVAEKTLDAADEGLYRFHAPRSSGVVQYPQLRRNYPSVHKLTPNQTFEAR